MCYTNKNGKILCDKEAVWYTKSVLYLLKLLINNWTKVNSSYYFCTVDLGLFLNWFSLHYQRRILFITVNVHDMISTAVLVTKQSRKQAKIKVNSG